MAAAGKTPAPKRHVLVILQKHGFRRSLKLVPAIAGDTWRQMERAQLLMVASSLAYTSILSLIPMLAVSFAIFRAFGGVEKHLADVESFIFRNLGEGSGTEVTTKLTEFLANAHTGVVGIGGLLGLIITSMSMLYSVEKAINQIWGSAMSNSIVRRVTAYWAFITLGPITLSIAVGLATSTEIPFSHYLPSGFGLFAVGTVALSLLYKITPNTAVHWPHAVTAAVVASAGLDQARRAYGLYASHVVTYSKIYGSLGAIPILLLWVYIVWVIILAGAAISAVLQQRLEERTVKK